ncbi:hypothetical protein FOA52_009740 [Chlamydomonas sp. UWO 241]|nr:hypothetical protein FOA52_009740 [Chlamydomonas sp. UWO 241]
MAIEAVRRLSCDELADVPVVLEFDAMELMQHDTRLAVVIEHTDDVRMALMAILHADSLLNMPLPRLWLRLRQPDCRIMQSSLQVHLVDDLAELGIGVGDVVSVVGRAALKIGALRDPVRPRLVPHEGISGADGHDVKVNGASATVTISSVLTSTNCGILVADGLMLGAAKQQAELASALVRSSVSPAGAAKLPSGKARLKVSVPVTATMWLSSHGLPSELWSKMHNTGGSGGGSARSKPPAGCVGPEGFDLVMAFVRLLVCLVFRAWHGSRVHAATRMPQLAPDDETLLQALPIGGASGSGSGGSGDATAAREATGWLRRQLLAARASAAPRFTPDAVSLLQRYVVSVAPELLLTCCVVSVPQATLGTLVSTSQLVGLLVSLALAAVRLLRHERVLVHPECTVAILLVDESLLNRLGTMYYNSSMPRMELPAGDSGDDPLDTRLFALHQRLELMLWRGAGGGRTRSVAQGNWLSCTR